MKVRKLALLLTWGCSPIAAHAALYFDTNALDLSEEQKQQLNLQSFSDVETASPGTWDVEVLVNGNSMGQQAIAFDACGKTLCARFTPAQLAALGVRTEQFPKLTALAQDQTLTNPGDYIPQATSVFDSAKQQLLLSIPQGALKPMVRGDICPDRWDDGLPMLFTSYNLNGMEARYRDTKDSSQYLNLRSGTNLGPWRVRNYSYYSHDNHNGNRWQSMQTWLERDIRALRSRLTMGQSATTALVFDSVNLSGLMLSSDDGMLPQSQQGFAPIIRGIAMSHAQVEVRQKGNIIYQTWVPPGAFEITDLFPTSSSGDLDVIIREEDGSVRSFVQPFSSAPAMVREGQLKYALSGGKYRSDSAAAIEQIFAQSEVVYGLLNATTIYGGLVGAEHYAAAAIGIGQGLGEMGAISVDVTHAKSRFSDRESARGSSLQFRYSKSISATETTMTLAGYRYSTSGYYSLEEASEAWRDEVSRSYGQPKQRMQLILNQNLGDWGGLSLSAYQQNYWQGNGGKTRSMTLGYNTNIAGVGVSLSYSNNQTQGRDGSDKVYSLNLSLPLNRWLSPTNTALLSYSQTQAQSGRSQNQATLSGTALSDNNLNYALSQSYSHDNESGHSSGSAASLRYTGSQGVASVGYSTEYGQNRRFNYGAQGALLVHPYGVTLGQELPEGGASALVHAPGGGRLKVKNTTGVSTDSAGNAIVPWLTVYQENIIPIDAQSAADDVEIGNTLQRVVPSRGALVLAEFKPQRGNRLYARLRWQGQNVPYGALVSADGSHSGIVNERGEVYLSGLKDSAPLSVSWGRGNHCQALVNFDKVKKVNGIAIMDLECRAN
ncbi:fimbria/pilus outer membrane usher protein [Kluyvera ascorbata]|uniref:fimbria/pilus outer membrane usher protein n=1 Tax=Kluyvera ascorbata TaxID=51288 RepID=UPI00289A70DE|nr:fimbria/pilus outer membrane usher protein [Kluyvera ascorbata]